MAKTNAKVKRALEKEAISIKFKASYYVALPLLIIIILFVASYLFYHHVYLPEQVAAIFTLRI